MGTMKAMVAATGLCLFLAVPAAQGVMAPHDNSNAIRCEDCHLMNEWEGSDPKLTQSYFLKQCERCHDNASGGGYNRDNAPYVQTHSSAVIGSSRYGNWTMTCQDCHGHKLNDVPLADGTVATYTTDGTTTVIALNQPVNIHDPLWNVASQWAEKSNPERGLILALRYFDAGLNTYVTRSFEVNAVATDGSSVTVQGAVTTLEDGTAPDGTFELYYGQFIREKILGMYPAVFNGPASFAASDGLAAGGEDSTPNGVCQVCHTQTLHWRQDGTRTADHFSGQACTACHSHTQGFKPRCDICHGNPPVVATVGVLNEAGGTDGLVFKPVEQGVTGSQTAGAHALHATASGYNFDCTNCHFNGMPATDVIGNKKIQIGFDVNGLAGANTAYDGQSLTNGYGYEGTNGTTITAGGSMRCSNVYCHGQGKQLLTGIQDFDLPSTSPAWNGSTADPDGFSCNNCHAYPPTFDAHKTHTVRGFQCHICHIGTTGNDTTIADRSLHVNGVYDVNPDFLFYARRAWHNLNFIYTFYPDGGVCSNNTCHQLYSFGDPKKWRNVPQVIANANLTFADAGTCQAGATSGDLQVSVQAVGCGDCVGPFTCDFQWGDGTSSTGVACTTTHTYADKVPNGTMYDPTSRVIGGFDVTWTIRDSYKVPLAAGTVTTRVGVCGTPNIPPTPNLAIAKGPNAATYDVCVTDLSVDFDANIGTHYDPTSPQTNYAAPGTIKIDWGGYAADGSGKGLTQAPVALGTAPSNAQFCFTYDRGGAYYIRHYIRDNDPGSSFIASPVKIFTVTK
ncbi:MAG: cytochrome c3 family protein [Thermodesulfobacteriota bacterium]